MELPRQVCKHWSGSAIAKLSKMPTEAKKSKEGWLYAMSCRTPGLENIVKFGGTGKCPFCRADEYCKTGFKEVLGMDVIALRPSQDWRTEESDLLALLGKPCKGREWFDDKDSRIKWALDNALMRTVDDTERFCVELWHRTSI